MEGGCFVVDVTSLVHPATKSTAAMTIDWSLPLRSRLTAGKLPIPAPADGLTLLRAIEPDDGYVVAP